MEIFNSLALFTIGFFILVKGAQILVRGAVSVANIFKVSTWFIGSVIVSIGTSIPELSINLASTFTNNDVGIATVIGSNIFNVFFVLGFMAIFTPIIMRKSWVTRDLPVFIVITLITSAFIIFPVLGDRALNGISQVEGAVLVGILLAWLLGMFMRSDVREETFDFEVVTLFTALVLVIFGVIGVFVGGRWVVDGAITLATLFSVSPAIIGLTVVALGTSLPEFVVSVVALSKGSLGIAVGNIIGSSIFNFLGVLGVTALIRPITVFEPLSFDITFVIITAFLWFALMFIGKKYTLSRWEGLLFVLLYVLYIISIFIR